MPILFGWLCSVIILVGFAVFWFRGGFTAITKLDELGTYLSALFTSLSFVWLAVNAFQQREDLGLQRKEMKANNEHQDSQAQHLRESALSMMQNVDLQKQLLEMQTISLIKKDFEEIQARLQEYCRRNSIEIAIAFDSITVRDVNMGINIYTSERFPKEFDRYDEFFFEEIFASKIRSVSELIEKFGADPSYKCKKHHNFFSHFLVISSLTNALISTLSLDHNWGERRAAALKSYGIARHHLDAICVFLENEEKKKRELENDLLGTQA